MAKKKEELKDNLNPAVSGISKDQVKVEEKEVAQVSEVPQDTEVSQLLRVEMVSKIAYVALVNKPFAVEGKTYNPKEYYLMVLEGGRFLAVPKTLFDIFFKIIYK